MQDLFVARIASELQISPAKVAATARLLAEGATVPFISRYRKEVTGSLDEVAVTSIRDRMAQLVELEQRRESIIKSLSERDLLSDALKISIGGAETLSVLEDLYAPYRPKRRTRATIAKEAGLEPLALLIFDEQATLDPLAAAVAFVDPAKQIVDVTAALAGEVHFTMVTIGTSLPYARNGRLRALGVSSARRSALAPDIPSLAEAGVTGMDVVTWYGLSAPRNLPAAIVNRLNREMVEISKANDYREQIAALGIEPQVTSPQDFGRYMQSEITRWSQAIKDAGLTLN